MANDVSLSEIMKVFLKLGFTAFGGPQAHIAMMRTEVVEKRNWISERDFLDMIGATNMIPGPNSTELAIFTGYKLQKWRGLITAGLSFILPAFFMVLVLAALYDHYRQIPDLTSVLTGMRPVVIGIVGVAIWKFSKSAVINWKTFLLMLMATGLAWAGVDELLIIFGAGFLYALINFSFRTKLSLSPELFLFFLKVGSVLFGSGYVLIAYLNQGLVHDYKWLTNQELLDAVTIGQVTPGPVFTTATFVGYLVDGVKGSSVSTLGIFLPSFIFVALITFIVPKMRASKFFTHVIDGVNAASVGLMIFVLIELTMKSLINGPTLMLFVVCLFIHLKFSSLNSAFLILTGALTGFFFL